MGKDWEKEQIDWDNWEWNEDEENGASQDDTEEEMIVKDANGNILQEGDSIIAIKDIKGKGVNIKRGDKFNNIKFTDDETHVYAPKQKLYLKTEFFKKA